MKTGTTFYLFNKNFLIEFDSSVICETKDLEERGPGQKFLFRSSCAKGSSFLLPVCRGTDTLYLKEELEEEAYQHGAPGLALVGKEGGGFLDFS
ncbi:hypothetical protein NN561_010116 [Cricetulus griseus]